MPPKQIIAELQELEREIQDGIEGTGGDARVIGAEFSLKTIASLITKGTTPTSVNLSFAESGVPFLRAQNIRGGRVDLATGSMYISEATHRALARSAIQGGDVLISIAGTIGRCAVVEPDAPEMNCNQAVGIIRPLQTVCPRYLMHWLHSEQAKHQISAAQVTGTITNLSLTEISDLQVPLPPIEGQRRIAAILDKAEALRAKRREAIAKLDTLAQSLFFEMFGDPGCNPKGWHARALSDVSYVKGGKRLPKGEEYATGRTAFPYIRVTDFQDGSIDHEHLVYLKPETQVRISRYTVQPGDIIISIAGSIGQIADVPPTLAGANLTENAAKIIAKCTGVYNPKYLAALLRTAPLQEQIRSHTGQVTIGKLALFRIEQIHVPIAPLCLQNRFAQIREQIEISKRKLAASNLRCEHLFASIQHRAFRGEL